MRHILPLTSLRFFAALLVVLFHAEGAWRAAMPGWAQNIVSGGYVGVPFFFVLSGFILGHNYLIENRLRGKREQFYVSRVARIYPVYLFSLLLACIGAAFHSLPVGPAFGWPGTTLFTVLLVQAWVPAAALWLNGPAWSLSVEAFFYAVFPFLPALRNGRTRAPWFTGAAVLCFAGTLAADRMFNGGHIFQAIKVSAGFSFPLFWLPLFVLGIGLSQARMRVSLEQHLCSSWMGLAVLSSIVFVLACGRFRSSTLGFCYVVAVPCAALIFLLSRNEGWLSRLLSNRLLVVLGEASYALYILHRPLFLLCDSAWRRAGWGTADNGLGLLVYLAVSLSTSVLVMHAIEKPARSLILSLWRQRDVRTEKPQLVSAY